MDLLCNSNPKEKIRLDFLPCKNTGKNMSWEEWHPKDYLRIYATDYSKLLPYFEKIFPIIDPTNNEIQSFFDVCWDNWIGIKDWKRIVLQIKQDIQCINNNDEKLFFGNFISWIEKQMEWADIIVVEGNQ